MSRTIGWPQLPKSVDWERKVTVIRRPLLLAAVLLTLLTPESFSQDVGAAKIQPDVVYGHKDGLAMTMDIFKPDVEGNGATILFMVSGGWYSRWAPPEQSRAFFRPYLEAGYKVVAIRHGSSPRYSIPEAVSDVRRAVRFVRQNAERLQIDADRMGVLGMSAGGHLALMLGTTGDDGDDSARDELDRVSSRVAAVVALVPPTDLRVAVWDSPDSLPAYRGFPALNLEMAKAEEHSPVVHASADDAPALVIMGGKDELVPPKHGEWIHAAFEKVGVTNELRIYENSGHGLEEDRDKLIKHIIGWFDQHLNQ